MLSLPIKTDLKTLCQYEPLERDYQSISQDSFAEKITLGNYVIEDSISNWGVALFAPAGFGSSLLLKTENDSTDLYMVLFTCFEQYGEMKLHLEDSQKLIFSLSYYEYDGGSGVTTGFGWKEYWKIGGHEPLARILMNYSHLAHTSFDAEHAGNYQESKMRQAFYNNDTLRVTDAVYQHSDHRDGEETSAGSKIMSGGTYHFTNDQFISIP